MLDLIRLAIALCGTAAACYFDIFHRKQIPDILLFGFLAVALTVNIFDYTAFLNNLLLAALLIALSYVLYRAGQIGGADVVLLAAIYAAVPELQKGIISGPPFDLPMPSIFPILATSVLLFAIAMTACYAPACARALLKKRVRISWQNALITAALIVVYAFFVYSTAQIGLLSIAYFALVTLIVFAGAFFTIFKDFIIGSMVVWKWTKEIVPEDVLALEQIDERIVKKLNLGRLVTIQQYEKMKKLRRKWPVLDLPYFTPYILVSLITYILFGNVFMYPI